MALLRRPSRAAAGAPGSAPGAIPPLDGALAPNDRLDELPVLISGLPEVADLVADGDRLLVGTSGGIVPIDPRDGQQGLGFGSGAAVLALASDADGLLVGRLDGGIERIAADGRSVTVVRDVGGRPLRHVTAISVDPGEGWVYATEGTQSCEAHDWGRDLVTKGRTGRLVRFRPDGSEASELLGGLGYPSGLAQLGDQLLLSEAWTHTVRRVPKTAPSDSVTAWRNAPGYPGRMSVTAQGDLWLCFFAMRTHLVELVLREDRFRQEMITTVPGDLWIRPTLTTPRSGDLPLQVGNVKALGVAKPWGPPRSYGLAVRLDLGLVARESLHSRVGGSVHGLLAAVVIGGRTFFLSASVGGAVVDD